jgi:imidazolonepropionase-like amidohydrolase
VIFTLSTFWLSTIGPALALAGGAAVPPADPVPQDGPIASQSEWRQLDHDVAALAASLSGQEGITIHAKEVHTSTGQVLENAAIVVANGKIIALTPGVVVPRDALEVHAVTAGMIEAGARIHDGFFSVEQSTEMQPHRDMADSLDPFDVRWKRLASSGVTTAFVAPLERNVVGGLGLTVKTAGKPDVAARTVQGRRFVTGVVGTSPSSSNSPAFSRPTSFYNRRPTTRMGVEWEWRKGFFDAIAAPRLPEREFPGADHLRKVLAGELGLYITAWATQDIRTAIFLKEELAREGYKDIQLVLEAAAEAHKEPKLLVRSGAAVILPPMPAQGRTTDSAFMPLDLAKQLADLGVPFALSAQDARDPGARLAAQAGFAMRGGLTREQALVAVTLTPARILGIDARVGSIEVGKDADLVLWNGAPFEATSGIVGVLVDGALVVDPRPKN